MTTPAPPQTAKPWALQELPPFPPVALRVMEELNHKEPDVNRVVGWIQSDPSFSAELLKVANSALYGFSYEIVSIRQAAIALGYDFVQSLAMTVALRNYLRNATKIPALQQCWRHCLATALMAEEVSVAVGGASDAAYTAGLLHDIGRLALMAAWPQEYANVLATVAEHGFALIDCEREVFDVDHCEAGLWLASHWKLPQPLADAIAHHHDQGGKLNKDDLPSIVRAACWLASSLGFGALDERNPAARASQLPELPDELAGRLDLQALTNTTAARIAAVS